MHFLANRGGCLGAAALCLLMFCNIAPSAVPESETEAALIYKIGKFVRWPEASFAASGGLLKLCIVGNDDFGSSVDSLAGQRLQGQVIAIERLSTGKRGGPNLLGKMAELCETLEMAGREAKFDGSESLLEKMVAEHARVLRALDSLSAAA